MLIYNHKKEFVGIDRSTLDVFGLLDLSQVLQEAYDFADLFVKTPGHIHNFKYVHWIDFVNCAETAEESKVIIQINNKRYKAHIEIKEVYLIDDPSKAAYQIELVGLRSLTTDEDNNVQQDASLQENRKTLKTPQQPREIKPKISQEKDEELYTLDDPLEQSVQSQEPQQVQQPNVEVQQDVLSTTQEKAPVSDVKVSSKIYDPHIASSELGLPVDLIEEFIQDFISQSKEFKTELYKAVEESHLDNLRIYSHKLKGVAANLRIEDAFELLTIINTSKDFGEVKEYLDKFYVIVDILDGKEVAVEEEPVVQEEVKAQEEVVLQEPVIKQELLSQADDKIDLDFEDDIKLDEPEIQEEIKVQENEVKTPIEDKIDLDFEEDLKLEEPKIEEVVKLQEPVVNQEPINQENDKIDLDFEDDFKLDEPEIKEEVQVQEEVTLEEPEVEEEIQEPVVQEEPEAQVQNTPQKQLNYDKKLVSNEIGISEQDLNELLGYYVEDVRLSCQNITEAISKGDFEKCKQVALKLKGMSNNIRVKDLDEDLDDLMASQDEKVLKEALQNILDIINQIPSKDF